MKCKSCESLKDVKNVLEAKCMVMKDSLEKARNLMFKVRGGWRITKEEAVEFLTETAGEEIFRRVLAATE